MNEWPLPGQVIEAENWMKVVLFAGMLVSAVGYFFRELRRNGWRVVSTYGQTKAAWASAMLFFGLMVQTFDVALVRHFQHQGIPFSEGPFPALGSVVGSALIIWGSICWMRAVMPLRCAPWAWTVLALGAVLLGVVVSAGVFF